MDNATLAAPFRELARLLEYHGENPFKIRSYRAAYDVLRKSSAEMAALSRDELQSVKGIGSAIADKIRELVEGGRIGTLERYREETPPVARELMTIRGLGPKKVRQLVEGLGVESFGELLHAVREHRVAELKGWSTKSQATLLAQLEFHERSLGSVLYAHALPVAAGLLERAAAAGMDVRLVGAIARQEPTLSRIELLSSEEDFAWWRSQGFEAPKVPTELPAAAGSVNPEPASTDAQGELFGTSADPTVSAEDLAEGGHDVTLPQLVGEVEGLAVSLYLASAAHLTYYEAILSCTAEFAHARGVDRVQRGDFASVAEVFAAADLPEVPAAQRDVRSPWPPTPAAELVQVPNIHGVVHAHTTWSDGSASVAEVAAAAQKAGYGYLVVTDHSRAAGYANGLSLERLRAQGKEIEALNATWDSGFRIFRGTECDILRDGSLDYADEVLADLDCVIASVHSVLRMSEADATERLLRAVANPYVDILGHPTGRLLLGREGYPLDVDAVLDACAENGTALELNASPYRLDLDWRHLGAARERGIPISVNPDAHSTRGIADVRWGVAAAQKAGLRAEDCLNARSADDFAAWLAARRPAAH